MRPPLGPLVRLPLAVATSAAGALSGLEPLVDKLSEVAARALAVVESVERLPARLEAVLVRLEAVPDRVEAVLSRADAVTAELAQVVGSASASVRALEPAVAALDVARVAPLVTDLSVLLAGVRELDPTLLDDAAASVRALPTLLEALEVDLLPALAAVEGLVPVVAQLGVHVDHLDGTVAEVGAMLSGIPGAARLLKRGATRPPV